MDVDRTRDGDADVFSVGWVQSSMFPCPQRAVTVTEQSTERIGNIELGAEAVGNQILR